MREPFNAITHLTWAILGIPAGLFLIKHSFNKWSVAVFAITIELCYISSFLFHAVPYCFVKPFWFMDNINIFLLIGGTFTPIICRFCKKNCIVILSSAWILVLTGIVIFCIIGHTNEFLYILVGFTILLCCYRSVPICMDYATIGSVIYIIGAIIEHYNIGGSIHHEVFHIVVMMATVFHYIYIYRICREHF